MERPDKPCYDRDAPRTWLWVGKLTFLGRRFVISLTALCCTRDSVVSLTGADALGLILLHGVDNSTTPMAGC
jgi:hypothetical protein